MGFTVPPRIRWFTVYVYDPLEMYYRLSAYLHYRYQETRQADLRQALVKRKKWPETHAQAIPRASLIGIFVAFRVNRIFNRWGMAHKMEQSAKASFNSLKVF